MTFTLSNLKFVPEFLYLVQESRRMRPREIFMHRTVIGWVIINVGRHCRAKIFYLPQPGIEPRSLDLQANTLPRRCKSRLLPQGVCATGPHTGHQMSGFYRQAVGVCYIPSPVTYFMATPLPNFHPIKLPDSSYKHVLTSRTENSVDPDQLASWKPADLDLHCFQDMLYP